MEVLREGIGRAWRAADGAPTAVEGRPRHLVSDFAVEFRFFQHLLLHSHGGLAVDVLAEWREENPGVAAHLMLFDRPIFEGVSSGPENRQYDHVLGLVRAEHAESLFDRLRSVTISDRRRHRFARVFRKDVRIVDPNARDLVRVPGAEPPSIVVATFGLDGNDWHREIVGRLPLDAGLPYVGHTPGSQEARRLADAYFGGADRPFAAIEEAPHLEGLPAGSLPA